MKIVFVLMMVALPCIAFAECRVVEFPDHDEAICDNNTSKTAASPGAFSSEQATIPGQAAIPVQRQTFEELLAEQEQANPDDEIRIERSELGRKHASLWLKTLPHE